MCVPASLPSFGLATPDARSSHNQPTIPRAHTYIQSPGRVFKGKKMPGQLGGERVTVQGLWVRTYMRACLWMHGIENVMMAWRPAAADHPSILHTLTQTPTPPNTTTSPPQKKQLYKIDTEKNLLYVRGHVPGPKGTYVRVTDAVKGAHFPAPPPVPTFVPEVCFWGLVRGVDGLVFWGVAIVSVLCVSDQHTPQHIPSKTGGRVLPAGNHGAVAGGGPARPARGERGRVSQRNARRAQAWPRARIDRNLNGKGGSA